MVGEEVGISSHHHLRAGGVERLRVAHCCGLPDDRAGQPAGLSVFGQRLLASEPGYGAGSFELRGLVQGEGGMGGLLGVSLGVSKVVSNLGPSVPEVPGP